MRPALTTLPVAPCRLKLVPPDKKSASAKLCVVATRAPTSTLASLVNTTPFGLIKMTWPLAVMRPAIWLACVSSTRLSVTAEAFGWRKLTTPWAPILKVSQLIDARWVVCVMSNAEALTLISAWPATTLPPVGNSTAAPDAEEAETGNTVGAMPTRALGSLIGGGGVSAAATARAKGTLMGLGVSTDAGNPPANACPPTTAKLASARFNRDVLVGLLP